ncbi:MAG: hypothetical protein ACI97A_003400 [Planctomycetota bacterium]|jgi:hypothetical protein
MKSLLMVPLIAAVLFVCSDTASAQRHRGHYRAHRGYSQHNYRARQYRHGRHLYRRHFRRQYSRPNYRRYNYRPRYYGGGSCY